MKDTFRKWGKRLVWAFCTVVVLYATLKVADYIWFRVQIPVGFSANWSGGWQTEQYGGLSGRLLVQLPDPLTENEDFKAVALVYYPIYCPWKIGQFVKMDFTGRFSPEESASLGQSANTIPEEGILKKGGKLSFKGSLGSQVVEYVAIMNATRRHMVGGYQSRSPSDYGIFWIKYY